MDSKSDLKALSKALDAKFSVGGFKFGYDGLLGLIPVFGNGVTMTLSMYIVMRAILMRYPSAIILKMIFNILVENIIGIIPILGNIFDFAWKSNLKNISLLEKYDMDPRRTERASKRQIIIILLSLVGLFVMTIYLIIKLTWVILENLF